MKRGWEVLVVMAGVAACSPADHAYYARGTIRQAVSDGFAATAAYDRYLQTHNAPPASPADLALAPRAGIYSAVAVEKDRIVLVLDSNLPTGKFAIAGKRITFSAKQEGGKRIWICARGDLEDVLVPGTCRGR